MFTRRRMNRDFVLLIPEVEVEPSNWAIRSWTVIFTGTVPLPFPCCERCREAGVTVDTVTLVCGSCERCAWRPRNECLQLMPAEIEVVTLFEKRAKIYDVLNKYLQNLNLLLQQLMTSGLKSNKFSSRQTLFVWRRNKEYLIWLIPVELGTAGADTVAGFGIVTWGWPCTWGPGKSV